jgi:hypothetical protein
MQLLEWVSVLDATGRLRAAVLGWREGPAEGSPLENCGDRRMDYRGRNYRGEDLLRGAQPHCMKSGRRNLPDTQNS